MTYLPNIPFVFICLCNMHAEAVLVILQDQGKPIKQEASKPQGRVTKQMIVAHTNVMHTKVSYQVSATMLRDGMNECRDWWGAIGERAGDSHRDRSHLHHLWGK